MSDCQFVLPPSVDIVFIRNCVYELQQKNVLYNYELMLPVSVVQLIAPKKYKIFRNSTLRVKALRREGTQPKTPQTSCKSSILLACCNL